MKVAAIALQGAFIGAITLADKIAYILAEGIQLGSSISIWVYHFMRKLMESLNIKISEDINKLTQSLMQSVLVRILSRMNQNAKNAVSKATGE